MKLIIEEQDLLDALALAFEFGKVTVNDADKNLHARNVQQSLLGRSKLKFLKSLTLEDIVKELSNTIVPPPTWSGPTLRKALGDHEGGLQTCEGKAAGPTIAARDYYKSR